jgi:phosphoserine phosphatase
MVGVMQLLNKHDGVFDKNDEIIAATLAAQCAVALQRTRMNETLLSQERLDEEVSVAREIQMSTLPTVMPEGPGYDVYGTFLPTDQTGGDTFDLVMLNDQLFMLMGDATGHGFGPALSATQMQAMLRVAFRCGVDLDAAFCHVNNQLAEDLPDDRFVTAFMGFLDPPKHTVRFHSGGQGPILHFHAATGDCEWHKPTSFPLGVLDIQEPGEAKILIMQPGDILGLISDGVYEYENLSGDQFGEEGVGGVISDYHDSSMSELADRLLIATFKHGDEVPQADDITVALIRRTSD